MADMRILVIDDADMTSTTNYLKATLSKEGVGLMTNFIQLNSDYYGHEDKLDLERIRDGINQIKQQGRFDLIMVDYDYGKAHEINGISIIRILREAFPKVRIILYSGLRHQVIKDLIQTDAILRDGNTADYEQIASRFDNLMQMKIEAFIKRDGFVSEATKMLKQKKCKDVKELLMDKLSLHPDLVVHAQGMRGIDGKSLSDIVKALDSDAQAQNWLDEILEELVVYLVKIYE